MVKSKSGFFKALKGEMRQISKPSRKEQIHGTWNTFVIAVVAAFIVSAFDSVFTALIGLFV